MGAWLLAKAKPPQGHYNITMVKCSSDIVIFDPTFTHAKLTTLKIVLLPSVTIKDEIFFSRETEYQITSRACTHLVNLYFPET